MGNNLTPEFNSLGRKDRYKLKTAAMILAVSGFVNEDSRKHPWRFPFYVGYVAIIAAPLPLLGAGVALLGATYIWTRMEMTSYTRRLNKRLKEAFNEKSIMDAHGHHVVPASNGKVDHCVNGKSLMKEVSNSVYRDTKDTSIIVWNSFKKLFR